MSQYGKYYWAVCVPNGKSETSRMFWADTATVVDGALVLARTEPAMTLMVFAPGQWRQVHAASVMSGHPVCEE